jgi:hypothetical protein
MATHSLKLCSYNSRGHGLDRIEYMRHLMEECDILFVQEHWYFEHDIKLLQESIDNVQVYGISGMNNNKLLVVLSY